MSQLITLPKQEIVMHNVYCSTSVETAEKVKQIMQTNSIINNEQLIEISFDQYEEVIQFISAQLEQYSSFIVKKGAFTYEQVKHIAEACCLHELHYLSNGEIELDSTVLSMSAVISFAQSKWNGADRQTAIKNAVYTGISIFGEAFAEEVIVNQLTQLDDEAITVKPSVKAAIAKNGTKAVAKKMATKVTKKAMISSAVAKKTIMFLNANVVTGALVTGVLSTIDIVRTIKGELSPKQLFKNVTKTAASVAGGIIGMLVFAGIGLKIPSVSTAIISLVGGVIGLIVGSILMTKVVSKVLDLLIQDDSKKMLAIFNEVLAERVQAYLLNEEELHEAIADFNMRDKMKDDLREMYASENRQLHAQEIIDLELNRIVKHRMYLHIPTNEEVYEVLAKI